jgi:hypothetical protein
MPIKKFTRNQLQYQISRKRNKARTDRLISKDYIRLAKQNKSKQFIMSYLQNKYKNAQGNSFTERRIYDALNLRKINREIRAMQECNPKRDA